MEVSNFIDEVEQPIQIVAAPGEAIHLYVSYMGFSLNRVAVKLLKLVFDRHNIVLDSIIIEARNRCNDEQR